MTTTPRVALVGTLDTKGAEYRWMADRLGDLGVDVVVVDTGVRPSTAFGDGRHGRVVGLKLSRSRGGTHGMVM